jgi:tetratricopeptide (TPR) repeat protein
MDQPPSRPEEQPEETPPTTTLGEWNGAIDRALARGAADDGARMVQIVLAHLPRHLATYQRLLLCTWQLKRWNEGEDWARRLLQADPGNPIAWQAIAAATEERGRRAQAQAMWQRAFAMSPYAPEIRAGLARTSLDDPEALTLDLAALAMLYLRGGRWEGAARLYRQLVKADPRRIDFQICLMVALWQNGAGEEAYALARHLVQNRPHLLLAWVVLDAIGDQDDQALAEHPIRTMDPDGEYVSGWLGLPIVTPAMTTPPTLIVRADEGAWLVAYGELAA